MDHPGLEISISKDFREDHADVFASNGIYRLCMLISSCKHLNGADKLLLYLQGEGRRRVVVVVVGR